MYLQLHAQEQNIFEGDTESVSKLKVEFPVAALKKVFHQCKLPKQRQKPTYGK